MRIKKEEHPPNMLPPHLKNRIRIVSLMSVATLSISSTTSISPNTSCYVKLTLLARKTSPELAKLFL